MNSTTTICAIATAPGGAIGIIRLSGPRSIELVDQLFTPSSGLPLSQRKAGSLTFGTISHQGEIL
ncbi:MAG: tRNA uridine-5-carboxymethylaminomethyl(34) synthesis GTPase MnmE, partial [Bacteroidaceae bacterium]|nr:tRNA uridine-5-carboxymethylaminomethyl(34) synthesis GTPase MnmE [Bacteroidaceae bacterium]